VALMAIDAPVVSSRMSTTVGTTTIRAGHAGAGWADAFGAEVPPSVSSIGTLVCRGLSTT